MPPDLTCHGPSRLFSSTAPYCDRCLTILRSSLFKLEDTDQDAPRFARGRCERGRRQHPEGARTMWQSGDPPVQWRGASVKNLFSRLLSRLGVASKQELEGTKRRLEQAQRRNQRLEQQLEGTKGQLQQARQQNQKIRQRLKRTRQQATPQEGVEHRPKRSTREDILHRMPKESVCAEIGVDRGDLSSKILEVIQPKRLHLIDPWKHEEEDLYRDSRYGGLGPDGQIIMEKRYNEVTDRFAEELRTRQVLIHRSFSDVASEEFEDSYFDWVYIDGNHLYEFVKKDLELYYPKIKVNGYITGDDYGAQDNWWANGVQKAVDEFVSHRPDLTLEVSGRQFSIKKGVSVDTGSP